MKGSKQTCTLKQVQPFLSRRSEPLKALIPRSPRCIRLKLVWKASLRHAQVIANFYTACSYVMHISRYFLVFQLSTHLYFPFPLLLAFPAGIDHTVHLQSWNRKSKMSLATNLRLPLTAPKRLKTLREMDFAGDQKQGISLKHISGFPDFVRMAICNGICYRSRIGNGKLTIRYLYDPHLNRIHFY